MADSQCIQGVVSVNGSPSTLPVQSPAPASVRYDVASAVRCMLLRRLAPGTCRLTASPCPALDREVGRVADDVLAGRDGDGRRAPEAQLAARARDERRPVVLQADGGRADGQRLAAVRILQPHAHPVPGNGGPRHEPDGRVRDRCPPPATVPAGTIPTKPPTAAPRRPAARPTARATCTTTPTSRCALPRVSLLSMSDMPPLRER